jgi:hypothetical protein
MLLLRNATPLIFPHALILLVSYFRAPGHSGAIELIP